MCNFFPFLLTITNKNLKWGEKRYSRPFFLVFFLCLKELSVVYTAFISKLLLLYISWHWPQSPWWSGHPPGTCGRSHRLRLRLFRRPPGVTSRGSGNPKYSLLYLSNVYFHLISCNLYLGIKYRVERTYLRPEREATPSLPQGM